MSNESNSDESVDDLKTKTESSEVVTESTSSGFPLNIDNRFEYIKDLGKGGGGLVCLAYDHKLQRKVALKFLLSSDLIDIKTLFKEARAQAQLKHESICQIYEVLEAENQIYLVMQYIQGDELEHLSDQFTLEQKLLIIKKILRGLHQSHTLGIIHRDIKPSNILVEVSDQGEIKPYLIDFGIAHAHNKLRQDVLVTGIGTPIYMAPEQADHQSIHIDRRADIYSIGATLYHLLCGFPPVKVNETTSTTSRKWTDFLGEPLMSFAENVPEDLQTLIIKCLEIEPKKRYSSAKELADEIEKYLNGEPISAHKGNAYRVKKKIRKNKVLVSITSVFLLALISTGGWFIYENHQQSIREELIQDFTSRVENLEARVRFTYMAPLHDISPAIEKWRLEIKELEKEIENLGEIAYGPGHYAIGRMHYAFQEYDDALEHLNLAWESGFQQSRVAYVLALTNGAIYQRQKNIANNISSEEARKDRLARLDKTYRLPAIKLLEQGMDASPHQSLARATLYFYQEKFDYAMTELKQESEFPVWFYLHHLLAGDILHAQVEKYRTLHKHKEVKIYTQRALKSYSEASKIAPSDYQLQLKPAHVIVTRMSTSLYSGQGDFDNEYEQAKHYMQMIKSNNSNHYQSYYISGKILSLKSEFNNQHSGNAIIPLEKAIKQLVLASELEPKSSDVWMELALAYSYKVLFLQERGSRIENETQEAINAFENIAKSKRDSFFYNSYGNMMKSQALVLARKDFQKSIAYFETAAHSYKKVQLLQPNAIAPLVNLGSVYRLWSELLTNSLAKEKLQQAINEYEKVKILNDSHFVTTYYLGATKRRYAQIENGSFEDSSTSIAEASQYLEKAVELGAGHPFAINEITMLNNDQLLYKWQKGLSYKELMQEALVRIENSIKDNPENHILLSTRATLYLTYNQLNHFSQQLYKRDLETAERVFKKSLKHSNYSQLDYYLLKLLRNEKIELEVINSIKESDDRSLLVIAEWNSQNNFFEKAESLFNQIKQLPPSLILKYRYHHLLRWQNYAEKSEKKLVKQKLNKLGNEILKNYPSLFISKKL